MVACSPGCPSKRTVGGITNSTSLSVQHDAEMRHGHVLAVDGIGRTAPHLLGREMGDDLMAEQVEIDPMVGAAPFGAAEQPSVEAARGTEVVDRKGKMERRQAHSACLRGAVEIVEPFLRR